MLNAAIEFNRTLCQQMFVDLHFLGYVMEKIEEACLDEKWKERSVCTSCQQRT